MPRFLILLLIMIMIIPLRFPLSAFRFPFRFPLLQRRRRRFIDRVGNPNTALRITDRLQIFNFYRELLLLLFLR